MTSHPDPINSAVLEVPSEHPAARWDRRISFLAGAVVLAGLVAVATASLPPRFRWLGLLAALQGVVIGSGLRLWRERVSLPHARNVVLVAAIVGLLTWCGTTAIHVRARLQQSRTASQMVREFAVQARDQGLPPEDLSALDDATRMGSLGRELPRYVRGRVNGWTHPWPFVLWAVEGGLAAFAAAWFVQPAKQAATEPISRP